MENNGEFLIEFEVTYGYVRETGGEDYCFDLIGVGHRGRLIWMAGLMLVFLVNMEKPG